MHHTMTRTVGIGLLVLALWASQALAVTATGFMGDDVIARGYNSLTRSGFRPLPWVGSLGWLLTALRALCGLARRSSGFSLGSFCWPGACP